MFREVEKDSQTLFSSIPALSVASQLIFYGPGMYFQETHRAFLQAKLCVYFLGHF